MGWYLSGSSHLIDVHPLLFRLLVAFALALAVDGLSRDIDTVGDSHRIEMSKGSTSKRGSTVFVRREAKRKAGVANPIVSSGAISAVQKSISDECPKDRILRTFYNRGDWKENMAPPIRNDMNYDKEHPGSGVAVLLIGQVRTGIDPEVATGLRHNVFDVLKKGHAHVEVFAILSFISGGYPPWEHNSQSNEPGQKNINRSLVVNMLQGYGVNYTLKEETENSWKPDFVAEGCCLPPEKNCAVRGIRAQWLKVYGALQMMKEAEGQRNQRYAHVLKLRPDIKVYGLGPQFPNDGICAAGYDYGNGRGKSDDALLMFPRWAVEALDGMWRLHTDCPVPGVDKCRSTELTNFCKKDLREDGMLCDLGVLLNALRFGLRLEGCGHFQFARPGPEGKIKYGWDLLQQSF